MSTTNDPRTAFYDSLPAHQRPFSCSDERAKELTPLHSTDLSKLCAGHLTHDQVAAKIRMLMRDTIDHEMVCTMARDRIKWMAWRIQQLETGLLTISEFPAPEQDNMPAANMREIALKTLNNTGAHTNKTQGE